MSNPLTTSRGAITIRSVVPDGASLLREPRLEALASEFR